MTYRPGPALPPKLLEGWYSLPSDWAADEKVAAFRSPLIFAAAAFSRRAESQ